MFVADLLEDARSVVAIFPGRFHPFHKGHAYMYQQLVSRYGRDRSFIATSNKVEQPKSPFSFSDKAQMMRVAGIPTDKIVETRNPYQAQEIVGNFDPTNTILIFAVSQKDMDEDPRFSFAPKKDGSPSYLQRLPDDLKNAKTLDQHGYITTLPTLDFTVLGEPMRSATELRAKYAAADDDTRKAIIKDLYGTYSEEIKHIMDNKIGDNVSTSVDESILGRILHSDQYKKAARVVRDLAKNNSRHSVEYWASEVIRRNSLKLDARTLAKLAIQTEEVDLTEDWRKSLTAAAVALGVAGAPATAHSSEILDAIVKLSRSYGNISKITKSGVEAEINQELKNQIRRDANSRNLRLQNRNQITPPTQNRWSDNATIKGSNESKNTIDETFDAPYPMTWEHDEGESHDALVKLPDGGVLTINFYVEYGDEGQEEWIVEFWRDNTLDVTGTGDQQRIFATVLSAIQQFIKIENPERIRFSAAKQTGDMTPNASRTSLYNKLVQRYAKSWGYNVKTTDHSLNTVYELERLQEGVAEDSEEIPQEIYNLLDELTADDTGSEDFGNYVLRYEGFTDWCQQDAAERCELPDNDPRKLKYYEDVYDEVLQGWIQEQGSQPVDKGFAGDEDYPVQWAVFKKQGVAESVGRIVKGVNTTPDVGVNQVSIEAAKFGNKVDKDGRPPTLSTKVKGKSTNVAFNLGLTESLYKLNRDDPMNSEVLISGMGRYNIKTLHKNLAEKFKDLSERMASMSPDQAQQARYLLTKSPLIPMMDALQQAYDDLKEIKRKGGVKSRGIDL